MSSRTHQMLDIGRRWLRWLLRPNPRRFLAGWYTVWLLYDLKGFFVNWLSHHQPIRIGWMTVTGPLEGMYLLGEMAVVGWIAWRAWRRDETGWRVAVIYEWYSLAEIALSALQPQLWTYALNQMWCTPIILFGETFSPICSPMSWSGTTSILLSHLGFIGFYALIHHGLPLFILTKAIRQATQHPTPILSPQPNPS